MATFLFDEIIFGPVPSRRLGQSLGINLLPTDKKVCNFDCIYCECGLTETTQGDLPKRGEVKLRLQEVLQEFSTHHKPIDTITYAGNGEPTLHPEFSEIIDDTCALRDKYFPNAKIALLTNSTTVNSPKIREALGKIDQSILKLDSVHKETIDLLNCPIGMFNVEKTIEQLINIPRLIIQTMFVRGTYKGKKIDNTTEQEVVPWLDALRKIRPTMVMIYTIARDTPIDTLEKVSLNELETIAARVSQLGIEVQISS